VSLSQYLNLYKEFLDWDIMEEEDVTPMETIEDAPVVELTESPEKEAAPVVEEAPAVKAEVPVVEEAPAKVESEEAPVEAAPAVEAETPTETA